MHRSQLVQQIRKKKSLLCVGLDSDFDRIPQFLKDAYDRPVVEFNRRIIEATAGICVAYKFNIAFYESRGTAGWEDLKSSLDLIPEGIFTIADAKRGDIGNTSRMYAKTFFETLNFDAVTVAPYMGMDSLEPFYAYDGKWVIVLALTSNDGSKDFQMLKLEDDSYLFERVLRRISHFGHSQNTMFVVGATNAEYLKKVRSIIPDHFLLIPGIGKQGGDLDNTLQQGLNEVYGLLINSSRGIIFASDGVDFHSAARDAAQLLNDQIRPYFRENK